MKKVYLIRHGESEGNFSGLSQDASSTLTDTGKDQASFVANRIFKFDADVIISSSMVRAEQTAKIISDKINKPLEFSDLFVERRRPTEQYGLIKYKDLKWLEIEKQVKDNFDDPSFHYSDEETFYDLKYRAKKCFEFLESRNEKNIIVVTHGMFLIILTAYAVLGEDLTGKECQKFMHVFHSSNTGLTIFRFDEEKENPCWRLDTWNDIAHI